MSSYSGAQGVQLGPPSPSTPTTPTTPTALTPASRDFLVPIGTTGALQKFSVANAAQKRKAAADRRAQVQAQAKAHLAASQAGWSALELDPSTANAIRPNSSLGAVGAGSSSHSLLGPGTSGYGSSRNLGGGLAPIEVYHRPSSASSYMPRSAGATMTPTFSSASANAYAAPTRPAVDRMRTNSSNGVLARPPLEGSMNGGSAGYRDSSSHTASSSFITSSPHLGAGASGSGTATHLEASANGTSHHSSQLPNEKRRTFSKGLRGLFSSSSTRKNSVSSGSGSQAGSLPYQQPDSRSSTTGSTFWSGSSANSSGSAAFTESPDASFERGRFSSFGAKGLQTIVDPHSQSGARERSPNRTSYVSASQPPRGSDRHVGDQGSSGGGGSMSRRRTEASGRAGMLAHAAQDHGPLPPIPADADTPSKRSRILTTLDSFSSKNSRSNDETDSATALGGRSGDSSGGSSTNTPRLGVGETSRRQSMGPPKLDFNLPSPGFTFDDMERGLAGGSPVLDGPSSPRSRSSTGQHDALNGEGRGAEPDKSRRRSSRAAQLAQANALTIDSSAAEAGRPVELGRAGKSTFSSAPSTASLEFNPGPTFGQYVNDPGSAPATLPPSVFRSPSMSAVATPRSEGSPSGGLSPPPQARSQRSSVGSSLSQATSIVAINKGWQVEPDINPPPHPSVLYGGLRSNGSMASLSGQVQSSGVGADVGARSRSSSIPAAGAVTPSDGRTSVASTVNRAGSATPLGRSYATSSTMHGTSHMSSSSAGGHHGGADAYGTIGGPNPLLAPLFESFGGSTPGTDDGSSSGIGGGHGSTFRSRTDSFDSGTHGHSSFSQGHQGNSTLGHGTMGHGTPAAMLLNRSLDESGSVSAGGSGSGGAAASSTTSHSTSAQGHHTASSGSSWGTASSTGHGYHPRREGSSGGLGSAATNAASAAAESPVSVSGASRKPGRPITPRSAGTAITESTSTPAMLRSTPSAQARAADAAANAGMASPTRAGMTSPVPSIPLRSKDRPRPGTGSSSASGKLTAAPAAPSGKEQEKEDGGAGGSAPAKSEKGDSLALPSPDPAMLATLAKLENAQAGSTSSPLNLATFSEAHLRDALHNGGIDVGQGASGRERDRSGRLVAAEGDDHQEDGDPLDVSVANVSTSGSVKGNKASKSASSIHDDDEQRGATESKEAASSKPAMLKGLPVPEGVDPKTYVPPNALTRTRRGIQVGASLKDGARANGVNVARRSAGRFSLDSDGDDDAPSTRDSGLEATTPTPTAIAATPTPGEAARPTGDEDEEDLSSVGDMPSDEDDGDLELLNSENVRNRSADSSSTTSRGTTPAVDSQMPANAWVEVEAALRRFQEDTPASPPDASTAGAVANDKGTVLRSILLPFLALEVETPNVEVLGMSKYSSGKARRALFFDWIRCLLVELQQTQTSADRGAILESIGSVLESRNLSARILEGDGQDLEEFNAIFGIILGWAIGELNKKGVYQNTLIFTGRLLAIAFFRIPGVASKLLRALPVNRFALERIASEAQWDLQQPRSFERYRKRFPLHLRDFCFQDARSYLKILDGHTPGEAHDADDDRFLVRQDEVEVEMAGNWLRRWQSDDSELFFSFIRSFHRQMATLLTSTKRLRRVSKWFFGGPGYAHLATSVHQKCLSMIHREIFSVTTLSSQKTFNPGDTANVLSGSTAGKPRHLEAANRRCTAIVVEIARTGNANPNTQLFGSMLGVHVKSVVKRTSLYDAEGVFCLLDWLDGIISHMDAAELPVDSLLDVDFVIDMVSMLLNTADHALALMRTIAFCYSNFGVLTSHKDTRLRFCERILLEPAVFHKLFLSWSVTIRAYFLHLLVFRLARISDFPHPKADPEGKTAVRVAKLFNQRLDEIRRRYEELSPAPASDATDDESDDYTRFKNRPSSFVSTIKHTPSIHRPEALSKAERILGIGMPDPAMASKGGPEPGKQSLASKWLRGLGSKGKKGRWTGAKNAVGMTESDSPTVNNEPRRKMMALDDFDFDDGDADDSGDSDGGESEATSGATSVTTAPTAGGVVGTNDGSTSPIPGSASGVGGEGVNGADSVSDVRAMAPVDGAPLVSDPDIGLGDHIAPDASFDLQSAAPSLAASTGPGRPGTSPRVSRAFSKRSSILPGPAFELVGENGAVAGDEDVPPVPALPAHLTHPYDKSLHTYAVQSLTEYERTIQEHDQYFAAQPENEKAQVPRLQVNWPAMWQD